MVGVRIDVGCIFCIIASCGGGLARVEEHGMHKLSDGFMGTFNLAI
jgi:hypothetical protein